MRPEAASTFAPEIAVATSPGDRPSAHSLAGSVSIRYSPAAPPWAFTRATPLMVESAGDRVRSANLRSSTGVAVAEVRL